MKFFFYPQLTDTFCNFYDPKNLNEVRQCHEDIKKNKLGDIQSIVTTTSEIRENIQNLKTDVLNTFFNGLSSTENIHKKMLDVETKITRIIQAIREKFLLLSKTEKVLQNDLMITEQRIKNLIKPLNPKVLLPVKSRTRDGRNEQISSTGFQEFLLSSGGHYGGWTHQDHFLFIKLRKKYSGKRFIAALQFLLPDVKEDDIVDHEKWFKQYEVYRNSHKNAIEKWKKEKQYQTEIILGNKSEKKAIIPSTKAGHHKNITHKITKWKQKQLIKKLDDEEKRQGIEKIKYQKEEMQKEIQKHKKKAISNYKTIQFNTIQEVMKNKNTILPPTKKNDTLLNSFKLQDLKFAEKKAKILQLKLISHNKKSLRLSKSNETQRDVERIFKPTFVWNMRCQQTNEKKGPDSFFYLNNIPKLISMKIARYPVIALHRTLTRIPYFVIFEDSKVQIGSLPLCGIANPSEDNWAF